MVFMVKVGIPLTMLSVGSTGTVVRVQGGHRVAHRLASMGILPGAQVSLIKSDTSGPVILEVLSSRFVIGRRLAHKIRVRPAG